MEIHIARQAAISPFPCHPRRIRAGLDTGSPSGLQHPPSRPMTRQPLFAVLLALPTPALADSGTGMPIWANILIAMLFALAIARLIWVRR